MSNNNANLFAMVGSRLCHDLISPIGAIQNGLELLAMAGDSDTSAEMALIQDSCSSATARIRFFRIAFGSAGDGQIVSHKEAKKTLGGVTVGQRISAEWQILRDLPRARVQLAYLAYLCCERALPQGGAVTVSETADQILVSAQAPRLKIEQEAWAFLSGQCDLSTISPDRVQFALLATLCADRDVRLAGDVTDQTVTISLA